MARRLPDQAVIKNLADYIKEASVRGYTPEETAKWLIAERQIRATPRIHVPKGVKVGDTPRIGDLIAYTHYKTKVGDTDPKLSGNVAYRVESFQSDPNGRGGMDNYWTARSVTGGTVANFWESLSHYWVIVELY